MNFGNCPSTPHPEMSKAAGGKMFAFQLVLDEHTANVKRIEEGGGQNAVEEADAYRRDTLCPAYVAAIAADPVATSKANVVKKELWNKHILKSLGAARDAAKTVRLRI